jgi:hypothetical protein
MKEEYIMKIMPMTQIKLEFMRIVLVYIFSQFLDEGLNQDAKEKMKSRCLELIRKIDDKMEEE